MAEFKTTNGHTVLVDEEDQGLALCLGNWMAVRKRTTWYAARNQYIRNSAGKIVMHRIYLHQILLVGARLVDHINGNGLDNRMSNIRHVTHEENSRNRLVQSNSSTGLRGVRRHGCRWAAHIRHHGQNIHIGVFDTAEQAHAAFLSKASELWSPADTARYRAMIAAAPKSTP